MHALSHLLVPIASLTRQFLNCWLEYVLSQPVDMDVSVMFYFLRSYFGLPLMFTVLKRNDSIDSTNAEIEADDPNGILLQEA